jgi:hypothetical protein
VSHPLFQQNAYRVEVNREQMPLSVHAYVGLMNNDAPYTVLRDAIHIHPTLAEAVQSAVAALEG